jgi:hypothetical protein
MTDRFVYYLDQFFDPEPLCFRKINTGPHTLARVNLDCPDDRNPKLKIYTSELILCRYEFMPAAYVIMHCVI